MISLTRNSTTNSKTILTKPALLKLCGVLLVLVVAALLGNYVALLATRHIDNMITRFIVGILIGFLTGVGVGYVGTRIWNSFQAHIMR
jgi:hypothetical protein